MPLNSFGFLHYQTIKLYGEAARVERQPKSCKPDSGNWFVRSSVLFTISSNSFYDGHLLPTKICQFRTGDEPSNSIKPKNWMHSTFRILKIQNPTDRSSVVSFCPRKSPRTKGPLPPTYICINTSKIVPTHTQGAMCLRPCSK